MTTAGGSGMDFGDDYVAARLSIDVPSESVGQIRELTEAVDRFHTSMQVAVRSDADMSRYLDQMTESSKRAAEAMANLTQQVSTQMSLTQHAASGGAFSTGVPGGVLQQPFQGGVAGMGDTVHTPGSRQPNPSDVAYQLQSNAATSPLSHLNFAQARGGVDTSAINISATSISALAAQIAMREHAAAAQNKKTGGGSGSHQPAPHHGGEADPYDTLQQRTQTGLGLAGTVMNEIGGGYGGGIAGMAVQGMNAVRKNLMQRSKATNAPSSGGGNKGASDPESDGGEGGGEDGSGMGGLTKGLGRAAGVITAATGGMELLQKGGGTVQSWRNLGAQVGGGAGEGFEASMSARIMGMDPTVSTEEARARMQAVMSGGYNKTGSKDDSKDVLAFLSNNLSRFGMDTAQSMQILELSGHKTKISLAGLTAGLEDLHRAAKGGFLSQADLVATATQNAQQLIAQGVDPGRAWNEGQTMAKMYSDNGVLAGKMNLETGPSMTAYERMYGGPGGTALNLPAGLSPLAIPDWIHDHNMGPGAQMNVLEKLARDVAQGHHLTKANDLDNPEYYSVRATFVARAKIIAPSYGEEQLNELFDKLLFGGGAKGAMDSATKTDRKLDKRVAGYGGSATNDIDLGPFGKIRRQQKQAYGSAITDRILGAYNGDESQVEVMDKNGKMVGSLDVTNQDMLGKLSSGEYRWRHKGDKGKGLTENDTPDALGPSFSTDHPFDKNSGQAGVHGHAGMDNSTKKGDGSGNNVQIGLTAEAKRLFTVLGPNPVPLSANQQDANAGRGTASVNNEPTSDYKWGH